MQSTRLPLHLLCLTLANALLVAPSAAQSRCSHSEEYREEAWMLNRLDHQLMGEAAPSVQAKRIYDSRDAATERRIQPSTDASDRATSPRNGC